MTDAAADTRTERDLLGPMEVPADAYYGVNTARALVNFPITGVAISQYPRLIRALAMVKWAAAHANNECGVLDAEMAKRIAEVCEEIIEGQLHDQFPVDLIQGGAGTSTNMNANEVIANRVLEKLGHARGDYEHCDPHDHVNLSQSTNDAYPTALKLAIALGNRALVIEMEALVAAFRERAEAFKNVIKLGRTQLQDAVPMSLGDEFSAWAASLENEVQALTEIAVTFLHVNMGGTAIGTGLNAPKSFGARCVRHLSEVAGLEFRLARDLIESTQDTQPFVLYSAALRSLAIKLSKICNDLRLLSSGPRAGLNEIELPRRQPGSSIMPGKVNPVIPEVVNQVCFRVIGNDLTVTMAAEAGQLQLNVMEPVIAACTLQSQTMFMNAAQTLRDNCVVGISANEAVCRKLVDGSLGIVTALNPVLGYERSTEVAQEALRSGRGVAEVVLEKGWLDEEQLADLLDPRNMI